MPKQAIDSRRRGTFADTLDLLLPHLPPNLVTESALSSLQTAARWLPPIPHGGFECRLQSASPQVDLQQSIYAKDHEAEILVKHLADLANLSPSLPPTWQRLSQFCLEWSDTKGTLKSAITEIWLELDLPFGVQSTAPAPVVFIGLAQTDLPSEKVLEVVNRSVELILGDPISAKRELSLMRCLSALPGKAHLRHFGVMAPRRSAGLRLNFQKLPVESITAYLKQCGWPGNANELELLIADCSARVDGLTVCLDVDESIRPQVGLECFFVESPEGELRSRSMLAWLVDRGLCTSEKRDALLAWPGLISPATASAPWADHLISAAFLQPPDRFSLIHRRLHHLKLTYDGTQQVTAKAYFGAIHEWYHDSESNNEDGTTASAATDAEPDPRPRSTRAETIQEQIEISIASATSYLLAARLPAGCWQDYSEIGASDEWVTAYVATALASVSDAAALQAARLAWSFLLERRRPEGGWGYGSHTPADADSTIWSLRLGGILNEGLSERAKEASEFLAKHQYPNGGIATYLDGKPVREFTSRVAPPSVDGWCALHPCVTAAAATLAPVAEGCRRFLMETQRADGSWPAYWWGDEDYTTALAAEALATQPQVRACVELAVQWARRRIGAGGSVNSIIHGSESAFATAWCVRTLALGAERAALQSAVNWLSENQLADGSWPASARLRIPMPDALDAEANPHTQIALDTRRVFTTATVLAALVVARNA